MIKLAEPGLRSDRNSKASCLNSSIPCPLCSGTTDLFPIVRWGFAAFVKVGMYFPLAIELYLSRKIDRIQRLSGLGAENESRVIQPPARES